MVSIVIVNWNSGPFLEKCVLSLLKHAEGNQIIVVDNASADSSLDFAANLDASPTILRNKENLGFAAANNIGWRQSKGEPILFLNPDTESRPYAVSRLARTLMQDATIWAAGGKLVSPSEEHQVGFNVRAFPTISSVAAEMLLLDEIWPGNRWSRRYRVSDWDHGSVLEVDQPAAACLMVRRSVLERIDGFDESFRPAWFEDVDLCRRIRDNGGRIVFDPGAEFLHHGGSSLKHLAREEFLEYFHINQLRYFRKHHGEEAARRVRRLVTTGMYLRAVLSLVRPLIPGSSRFLAARTFWRTARHFASSRQAVR